MSIKYFYENCKSSLWKVRSKDALKSSGVCFCTKTRSTLLVSLPLSYDRVPNLTKSKALSMWSLVSCFFFYQKQIPGFCWNLPGVCVLLDSFPYEFLGFWVFFFFLFFPPPYNKVLSFGWFWLRKSCFSVLIHSQKNVQSCLWISYQGTFDV